MALDPHTEIGGAARDHALPYLGATGITRTGGTLEYWCHPHVVGVQGRSVVAHFGGNVIMPPHVSSNASAQVPRLREAHLGALAPKDGVK